MTSKLGLAALEVAARGWPVFPLRPRDKQPLTAHGFHEATVDAERVAGWWAQWPEANLGVPTGLPETFDALDVDGDLGRATLEDWEAQHGALPGGPRAITGHGEQRFFRSGTLAPRNRSHRRLGIDVRAEGGYVVLAPSVHPNGREYVLEDADEPPPEAPGWLREKLEALARQASEAPAAELGPVAEVEDATAAALLRMALPVSWGGRLHTIPAGGRNEALFRWGASLRSRGQGLDEIRTVLHLANRHLCRPALGDAELEKITRSASLLEVSERYQKAAEEAENRASRASAATADSRAAERLEEAARNASERPAEALRMLEAELGLPVRRVVQFGTRPARYHLHLHAGGRDVVVAVSDLLSRAAVRRGILDQAGHLVPVGAKRWPAVAQTLRAVAEYQDPAEEGLDGELLTYVEGFVESRSDMVNVRSEDDLIEVVKQGLSVFRYGVGVWIHFEALADWCSRSGLGIPRRELAGRMREAGLKKKRLNVDLVGDGQRTTRRYWILES